MAEHTDSSTHDREPRSSDDGELGGNGTYENYSAGEELRSVSQESPLKAMVHVILVILLVGAAGGAYWWWVQGSKKITELVKEARDLQKADDFVSLKKARDKFDEAMKVREDDRAVAGLANLSVSLWGLHGVEEMKAEAEKWVKKAEASDIPSGDRFAASGYWKIFNGDPKGAEAELTKILKMGVADPKILHAVGLAQERQGQTRNSRQYFRKAIDLSAGEARYSASMGDAYFRDGEYSNAWAFYNRAAVANQGHTRGQIGKILAKTKQGADLAAMTKRIDSILGEPEDVLSKADRNFAEYTAAEIAFAQGDYAKANKFVDATMGRDDSNPRLHYLKGHLLYADKKLDEALKSFDRARDLDPYTAAFYFDVAEILRQEGRPSEAVDRIRAYGEKNFKSEEYKLKLAAALIDKGDYTEAERMLTKMLEANEYDPDVLYHLGYSYELQKKYDEARDKYGHAAEYRQGWGDPWYRVGHLTLAEGDAGTAQEYFTKALEKYVRTNAPRKKQADCFLGIAATWDKEKGKKAKKKAAAAREKAAKLLK